MFHRILTPFERRRIQAFLDNGRDNGTKDQNIRQLAHLANAYVDIIHEDHQLLLRFLTKYKAESLVRLPGGPVDLKSKRRRRR